MSESVLEKDAGKEWGGRQHQRERTQKGRKRRGVRERGRTWLRLWRNGAGCNSYRRGAGHVCVRMCADGQRCLRGGDPGVGRGYGCTAAAGAGAGRWHFGGRWGRWPGVARGAGLGVDVHGLRTSELASRRARGVFASFLFFSSSAVWAAEPSFEAGPCAWSTIRVSPGIASLCPESGAPRSAVAVVGPTSKATSSTSATRASRQK